MTEFRLAALTFPLKAPVVAVVNAPPTATPTNVPDPATEKFPPEPISMTSVVLFVTLNIEVVFVLVVVVLIVNELAAA
jgi:hypothetical protein